MATIKIKQIKSIIGRPESQVRVVKALKLGRIGRVSELPDTDSVRGMVAKVKTPCRRGIIKEAIKMKLNALMDNKGATHSIKRVGRGMASGTGKTGRGNKGQKSPLRFTQAEKHFRVVRCRFCVAFQSLDLTIFLQKSMFPLT